MEPIKNEEDSSENTYSSPKIVEVGTVEELTHGTREQTADDGSGYYGG
jgi:hypothetical protein